MSTTTRLIQRKPRTDQVSFCLDPDDSTRLAGLRNKAADAEAKAARARRAADRPDATSAARRDAATAEAEAEAANDAVDELLGSVPLATFHLVAIGPKKLESVMGKHPPTAEQVAKHETDREAENDRLRAEGNDQRVPSLQFNPDTFPPALIARSTSRVDITGDDPETIPGDDITAEVVAEMFEGTGWSSADAASLLAVCMMLNQAGSAVSRDLVDRLGKD